MKRPTNEEYIQEPISTVNGDQSIKRYTKIKIIGEGAFSKCWLVRTLNSDSTYAVKVIPTSQLKFLAIKKLVYEVRIHQQLSHPNVVHLDHWFEDEHNKYIFMEYCSEGNLQKRASSKRMTEREIAYFVKQVIAAISYLHSKDILHRDLKLSNFYINHQNQIKLGDFGFACQLTHCGELKRESCGTPNYVAPEAVGGFGYSFSSDVWAVGIMLYRLKFNFCPFEQKTVKETLQRVKICQYKFPKGEKISNQLKDLIQKILVINYDDRLTLSEILNHPFFMANSETSIASIVTAPVRSRSESWGLNFLQNLFDRGGRNKSSKEILEQQQRQVDKKRKMLVKENEGKHNNSCSTFKEIKEIFKNKNRGMITEYSTEENLGVTTIRQSGRGLMSTSTLKCIPQSTERACSISTIIQRNERLSGLGNLKPQLKISSPKSGPLLSDRVAAHSIKQLSMLIKRYYLPYRVQFERQVVVVHYKDSVKQIIYHGASYVLHRDKYCLYQMNGLLYNNPPKLLKYIVQNKIEVSEGEPEEKEYGYNTIEKILLFVAHRWHIMKDGIFLYFGNSGIQVAKLMNQELFYASDDKEEVTRENRLSLLYLREAGVYKCKEEPVQIAIYRNWVGSISKGMSSNK